MVAFSTVGIVEIIKNFVQKGGKRVWTLVTIVVGAVMVLTAFYLPEKVMYGIVGVTGATIFYDTIFKTFKKIFEVLSSKVIKDEE